MTEEEFIQLRLEVTQGLVEDLKSRFDNILNKYKYAFGLLVNNNGMKTEIIVDVSLDALTIISLLIMYSEFKTGKSSKTSRNEALMRLIESIKEKAACMEEDLFGENTNN